MAKAVFWAGTDAEERKHGEQTGLDTHAFVHQCQLIISDLPSQSVSCVISMHFTSTVS